LCECVCVFQLLLETLCTIDGWITSPFQTITLSTHWNIFIVKGKSAETQGKFVVRFV